MEKNYGLCLEVLKRLKREGVLNKLVIVGSWCIYFYKDYFSSVEYTSSIRTRDIDFLVPTPLRLKKKVDMVNLLKDLGFVEDFHGRGFIRLVHPDLIVEFLVPERGRGFDRPYPLPQLGINAQALRFMDFLANNTAKMKIDDIVLNLPHPAAFSFQKLLVSKRRSKQERKLKEKEEARRILNALIEKGEGRAVRKIFGSIPKSWQKRVRKELEDMGEERIIELLS